MTSMSRKECRKYYFSVEGETEKWYLKWLESQINSKDNAKYNVKIIAEVNKNPMKMVKKLTALGNLDIVHVFDFEESQNEEAFKNTLNAMKSAAKKKKKVKYSLGYSNNTFDLWIILHKLHMTEKWCAYCAPSVFMRASILVNILLSLTNLIFRFNIISYITSFS